MGPPAYPFVDAYPLMSIAGPRIRPLFGGMLCRVGLVNWHLAEV